MGISTVSFPTRLFQALLSCNSLRCSLDNPNESLLHTAVRTGHLEMVQLLVGFGADVNDPWSDASPLKLAIDAKHTAVAKYLRSAGGLEKSFNSAASDGDINLVQTWLITCPKCIKDKGE